MKITNFQQRFDESFIEAWDRFKDLLRACPHHGFLELHQLDTFYNALNSKDQDSLNFAACGNFLDKMPRECLAINESKSKIRYSRNKPGVAKVSTNTSTSGISPDVAELKDMVKALLLDKKGQNQSPTPVKAVEESCVTCGAYVKANDAVMRNMQTQGQNMQNQLTNLTDLIIKFVNSNSASTSSSGTLPSNTIAKPRSGGNEPEATKDTMHPTNNGSTEDVQPQVVQSESPILNFKPVNSPISEPVIAPVSAPKPDPKSSIPYPSRRNDERNRKNANNQIEKFYQIFKDMSFEISFTDALILMPKFTSTHKALIENKEKLSEMAQTLLNEHCSAVLLKKLPKKLRDPGKFLIPCDFLGMAECLALADLGASINLMPFSVWKRLYLPDLTPTCMTLELANCSISCPVGVAEDVYVKVGSFHFSADFVVVDFDVDPRVPLILGRSFLKTERALIDVFEGELTLQVGKEAITFNLDQTSRYSANYSDMTAKRIDVIDMACEEYSQEVLGFLINSDFLLEEVDAFLAIEDDPTSPEFYQPYLDHEGDILLLEAFSNDDVSPPPNQGNYLPEVRKELKIYEAKSDKSLIDEHQEVELKDLPPHLEYAFLEGDDKLPVIISKDLSVEEKTALITVLKSHKRAIAWKLSDIKGTFQRCMMAIFHDMIEKTMEVFMDDFSVFGNYFQSHLSHLERMLKRCEDTNLCLNWEKIYFMVKEGIVLGHKISKQRIEVDKAKVDVITKLPHPTTVKECVEAFQTLKRKLTEAPILIALDWDMPFELMCDASDFAIGGVLGKRQDKHFRPIYYASKTMTEAESNYTTTKKEMLAVEFTFKVIDTKGAENMAADHLSRLENPHQNVLDPKEINESFPLETLNLVSTRGENRASWSDKLDDALWAFRTAYKTPIGCTPYKLVYGKAFHLLIKLEHKAYWALKHANFNLKTAGDHRKVQINELNELRNQTYENSLIYKEKTKRLHDSKIKDRDFNIDDRVLLFNSRVKIFSGKLKSHWSGPFTISQVYPYGTVELSQPEGPNFKVNSHCLKHCFGEDIPKSIVPDVQTFPRDH
nr:reverse transcriptase domain-containing protein [Tanacetum cinerariifolium]